MLCQVTLQSEILLTETSAFLKQRISFKSFNSSLLFLTLGEYDANKCGSGQSGSCIPCNIRFPSCNGRPDGMNSWQGKEWSPYYVVCKQERISYHTMCKSEKTSSVFHPDKRACVQFDKVEEIIG